MLSHLGMAMAGSLRSPDRLAPATIPVTAGKKTANTEKKDWEPLGDRQRSGRRQEDGHSPPRMFLVQRSVVTPQIFPGCL